MFASWNALYHLCSDDEVPDHISRLRRVRITHHSQAPARQELKSRYFHCFNLIDGLLGCLNLQCADLRDKFFVLAALPVLRIARHQVDYPIDYNMSIEEVCATALGCYDRLLAAALNREGASLKNHEREPPTDEWLHARRISMLRNTVGRFGAMSAAELDNERQFFQVLVEFVFWLQPRVESDGGVVRLPSGHVIDCEGDRLGALLGTAWIEMPTHGSVKVDTGFGIVTLESVASSS